MTIAIAPVQTVAPTNTPVSLFVARAHLRVDGSEEDELIASLIDVAVSHLDGWSGILGRCLMTQTWRQDMGCFPPFLRLPFPNVQSVTVQYYDASNALQTVSAANYFLVNRVDGAAVELASTASWPSHYLRPDAVQITMVCGYTSVPPSIKAAILLHVAHLFVNREPVNIGNITTMLPFAYDALGSKYRMVGV